MDRETQKRINRKPYQVDRYDLQVDKSKPNKINTIISASAIGYYSNRAIELLTEQVYLAEILWHNAAWNGKMQLIKGDHWPTHFKFRTGVVLYKMKVHYHKWLCL